MKLSGQDRYAGFPVNTQHMYVLCIFNLGCVHVNLKRTNILHKCSEYYRLRAPCFKKHAVVKKSYSSSSSSAFYSSKVILKLYFAYER